MFADGTQCDQLYRDLFIKKRDRHFHREHTYLNRYISATVASIFSYAFNTYLINLTDVMEDNAVHSCIHCYIVWLPGSRISEELVTFRLWHLLYIYPRTIQQISN